MKELRTFVHKNYNDIKLMTAKKGTLIEDTRGLHKGSVVKN